jgi:hypothetical protein
MDDFATSLDDIDNLPDVPETIEENEYILAQPRDVVTKPSQQRYLPLFLVGFILFFIPLKDLTQYPVIVKALSSGVLTVVLYIVVMYLWENF